MRRLFELSGLCAVLSLAWGCSTQAPYVVSANPEAPPFSWLDNGELTGVGIDTVKMVLPSCDNNFVIQTSMSLAHAEAKAIEGEVDIIPNVIRAAALDDQFVFTDHYARVPVVVFVNKNSDFSYSVPESLLGLRGMAPKDVTFGIDFDTFASEKLNMRRDSLTECFRNLANGTTDYVICGKYTGVLSAYNARVLKKIKYLDVPVTYLDICMAIPKGSPLVSQLDVLNRRIRDLVVSGEIDKKCLMTWIHWEGRVSETSTVEKMSSPALTGKK